MKTSDVGIAQQAVPVIDFRNVGRLDVEAMLDDDSTRWYALRRMRALQAAGLLPSTAAGWDAKMHPRGRDGKFIEKLGFVRWLENGAWRRGQVQGIEPDGSVTVKDKNGEFINIAKPSQQIYSLPRPKGMLNLPGGGSKSDDGVWVKTGGQGGSNPGGKYKILDANATVAVPTEVSDDVVGRLLEDYELSSDWSRWKTAQNVIVVIDSGDRDTAKLRVLTRVGNDTDGDPIRMIDAVSGEQVSMDGLNNDTKASLWVSDGINKINVKEALASLTVQPPTNGDEVYVKNSKSESHAANELLANRFYELAGVAVPETFVDSTNPKIFGSKILPAGSPISAEIGNANIVKRIQDDMAIDAWLGNWDVAGLTLDNITVIDGHPYRIDAGGSMLYRAQGSPKGAKFGNEVGELETFRSSLNPSAAKIFAGTTDAQIKDGVERIAAISPDKIKSLVDEAQLPGSLADTLIARRDWLMKKYKVDEPGVKLEASTVDFGALLPDDDAKLKVSRIYDPFTGKWMLMPEGTKAPDADKAFNSSSELLLEQGDLLIGSNKAVMVGDTVMLNPTYLNESGEIWNGALPGMAYTVNQINPSFGAGDDQWVLTNNFTGVSETISVPSDMQVNFVGNWSDIGDAYKAYGMDGFKGAVNNSIGEHETLTKLFAVARANAYFDTKPLALDDNALYIQPSARSATSLVGLEGITANNAPKWIAWQSFSISGGDGSSGGFLLDVDATGAPYVSARFTNKIDGTYEYDDKPMPYKTYLDEIPANNAAIEVDPYTSIVANAMLTRHSDEVAIVVPKAIVTVEPDPIHADAPPIVAPDGVESPEPAPTPQPLTVTVGTGVNQWNVTEVTRDDIIEKLKSMPPVVDPDTGVVHKPRLNIVAQTKLSAAYWSNGVSTTPPGIVQVQLNSTGTKLEGVGGKYVDPWELNNSTAAVFHEIDSDIDMQAIGVKDFTFKQDGTLISKATGSVIGSWENAGYYGFRAKVSKKFTITGKDESISVDKKSELSKWLPHFTVDPAPKLAVNAQPIKKSAETLQVESIIKSEVPITTTNGVDIKPGVEVQSLYSGAYGKVDSYTPGETFAVIMAEDPEGLKASVKVIVDVKYLKAVGASLPAQTPKNLSVPPAPGAPKVKADVDPDYVGKLYPDGSQPKIGQKVVAGSGDKEMTGEVVGFNKENTYVKVKGPDGIKWRAITKTKLVSQPEAADVKEAAQPLAVQVEANTFVPEAEVGIPGTELPAADLSELQVYETVPQTAAQKKHWLDGNPKRQLMKGGLAPAVGMPVRVDDGTPMIITQMPKSDSASVILYDPKTGKTVSRGAQKLTLDEKKYFGSEGLISRTIVLKTVENGVEVVSEKTVPHGSIVFKVKGTRATGDVYYFLTPDGQVLSNQPNHQGNLTNPFQTASWKTSMNTTQKRVWMIENLFGAEKIGIASDLGDKQVMTQVAAAWYTNDTTGEISSWGSGGGEWTKNEQSGFTTIDFPAASAAETINAAFAKSKITSVTVPSSGKYEPPAVVSSTPGILSKPAGALNDEDVLLGVSPVVTGEGTDDMLSAIPSSMRSDVNAKSPRDAVTEIMVNRSSKEAGTGVRYSLADGDTVEDMAIRFQVVRDGDGNEYMEARYKLLEDKAEALIEGLVAPQGKKGAWAAKTQQVTPVELKEGDSISVRRASTGLLKPANGNGPNAIVTGDPVLVGTADASGYSLYRVGVVMGSGEYAEMDVELRDSPSIKTYEWDNNKVVSSEGKLELTPVAAADGWTRTPGYFLPYNVDSVSVDPTGAAMLQFQDDNGSSVGSSKRGSTLRRTLPNDVQVRIIGATSGEGGTGYGSADIRRNSFAGDVRVRVPIPKSTMSPEVIDEMMTNLSQGLEAAGLPIEKQEPPTQQQLVKFALNKLYKTHAAKFEHRGAFKGSGLPGDPATEQLLSDISQRIGLSKDPLTLNDLEFSADDDGRLTPRLSARAAEAITKQQGNKYYSHSIYGDADEIVINMLSSAGATGVMATEERWSMGVGTGGQSSLPDVQAGTGNGVYATGWKGAISVHNHAIVMSPHAMNTSLEVYTNKQDEWGKRFDNNAFASSGGNHEYMFKSRIPTDQIAYITVPHPKKVVEALKKRGVTHVNGRPVEEVVLSAEVVNKINPDDPKFQQLGVPEHVVTAADLAAGAAQEAATGDEE